MVVNAVCIITPLILVAKLIPQANKHTHTHTHTPPGDLTFDIWLYHWAHSVGNEAFVLNTSNNKKTHTHAHSHTHHLLHSCKNYMNSMSKPAAIYKPTTCNCTCTCTCGLLSTTPISVYKHSTDTCAHVWACNLPYMYMSTTCHAHATTQTTTKIKVLFWLWG